MFVRIVFVCVLLVAGACLQAQPVWHVHSETVLVQDSASLERSGVVSITTPSQELTARSGSTELPAAVALISPSLAIRSYGSQGSIAFGSFRGMPAEYVSIDYGGFTLTNAQNSLADLGLFNINSVDRVDLRSANSNAAASSVNGAASIGLHPLQPTFGGTYATIGSTATSYTDRIRAAEREGNFRITGPVTRDLAYAFGASLSSADGNFPFYQQSSDSTILRSNNDSHLTNATFGLTYRPLDDLECSLTSLYLRSERGSPGAVTIDGIGASLPYTRLFDERYLLGVSMKHRPLPEFEYTIKTSYQSQFESYVDSISPLRINDRYTNRTFSAGFDAVSHSKSWLDLITLVSVDRSTLVSNENVKDSSDVIDRGVYRANVGAKLLLGELNILGLLKTEQYSDLPKPVVLPQLTIRYGEDIVLAGFGIGGSYTKLYHAPTLNELYWKVGGNPSLSPETGDAFELVADAHISDVIGLTLSGFYNSLSDQIVWRATSGGVYSPFNVKSSRAIGIESSMSLRFEVDEDISCRVDAALTWQQTEDRTPGSESFGHELPYTTPISWMLSASTQIAGWGAVTLTDHYRGHRYPDLANELKSVLPGVALLTIDLRSRQFRLSDALSFDCALSVLNAGNEQYEEIPSYPMPRRSYKFGISIHHSHTSHE
ncbi:MAG: hypothetical protein JSS75_12915 [Bacteroidetes bacterium]|nr:hypothetical protein [Bacteroidota bacterium]